VKNNPANKRPCYSSLKDIEEMSLSSDKYITIVQLSEQFLITRIEITRALKEHSISPLGRRYHRHPITRKKGKGQPELVYPVDASREAIIKYVTD